MLLLASRNVAIPQQIGPAENAGDPASPQGAALRPRRGQIDGKWCGVTTTVDSHQKSGGSLILPAGDDRAPLGRNVERKKGEGKLYIIGGVPDGGLPGVLYGYSRPIERAIAERLSSVPPERGNTSRSPSLR